MVVAGGTVRWGTGSTLWSVGGLEREGTEPMARRALARQARQFGGDAVVLTGSTCESASYTPCAHVNQDFLIIRYLDGPDGETGG